MRSRFPHGGEVLGAAPANPILAPVLSQDRALSMSRQRDLLDLQAIRRIPGLVGYWKADPQYLFEDSAGTIPASTSGTGPVGQWRAVTSTRSVGAEQAGTIPAPTIVNNAGTVGTWDSGTNTMANTGATSTGYPRFLFNLGIVVGSTYLITGTLTGAISKCAGIRLVQTGVANNVPYDLATGIFSGEVTAAYAHLEIDTSLAAGESLVISSISVKPVTGNHAIQWTTANKPILRKTPTTGVYWADANTSTSALNVALSDTVLGRRNLLTYSEDFSTGWVPIGASFSNGVITEGSAGTVHHISRTTNVAAGTYTLTFEAKPKERTWVRVFLYDGVNKGGYFDLSGNGSIGSVMGGAITLSIALIDNGYYRITASNIANAGASNQVYLGLCTGDAAFSYAGDGTSGVYVRKAQLELGSVATNYQKITNVPAYCTLARATAEGVTFTDNAEISPTYNIAPAFGFNSDVAIFNRVLTATEKSLITRYMARAVPMLGSNLIINGTFDTDTTGWSAENSATLSVDTGRLRVVYNGVIGPYAKQGVPTTNGSRYLLACSLIRGNSSSGIAARVYADSGGSTSIYSSGYKIVGTTILSVLTASSNTSYIWAIVSASSNGTYDFADNISLKEIL